MRIARARDRNDLHRLVVNHLVIVITHFLLLLDRMYYPKDVVVSLFCSSDCCLFKQCGLNFLVFANSTHISLHGGGKSWMATICILLLRVFCVGIVLAAFSIVYQRHKTSEANLEQCSVGLQQKGKWADVCTIFSDNCGQSLGGN